jgi:hypothetical protein
VWRIEEPLRCRLVVPQQFCQRDDPCQALSLLALVKFEARAPLERRQRDDPVHQRIARLAGEASTFDHPHQGTAWQPLFHRSGQTAIAPGILQAQDLLHPARRHIHRVSLHLGRL